MSFTKVDFDYKLYNGDWKNTSSLTGVLVTQFHFESSSVVTNYISLNKGYVYIVSLSALNGQQSNMTLNSHIDLNVACTDSTVSIQTAGWSTMPLSGNNQYCIHQLYRVSLLNTTANQATISFTPGAKSAGYYYLTVCKSN